MCVFCNEEMDFGIGTIRDINFSVDMEWPSKVTFEVAGTLSCLDTTITLRIPSLQDLTSTCVFYEGLIESSTLDLQTVANCFGAPIDIQNLDAPDILKNVIEPFVTMKISSLSVLLSPNW